MGESHGGDDEIIDVDGPLFDPPDTVPFLPDRGPPEPDPAGPIDARPRGARAHGDTTKRW